jgi:hypothetical protein
MSLGCLSLFFVAGWAALLDAEGRLIGLSVAVSGCGSTERTRAYAIPFNADTRRAVARLRQGARVAIAE